MTKFEELNLDQDILKSLEDLNILEPTEIQVESIPVMMEGYDLIGQAQTGTGKTFAYGIPLVSKLINAPFTQALVLCPTRELALQVSVELNKLIRYKKNILISTIYGGESYDKQIRILKKNPQIIVGTPGRIIDHMNRGTIHFDKLQLLVLDEADEMLKMGFQEDLETILSSTPSFRQTALFSATMPDFIKHVAQKYQNEPKFIEIKKKTLTVDKIKQNLYFCKRESKIDLLIRLLDYYQFKNVMIFANTKSKVDEIVGVLKSKGYNADALHGDIKQASRDRVMDLFKKNDINILVCTDVAARGIDVKDLSGIINFDLPIEDEVYVHRIGRTGRAGNEGISISIATPSERRKIEFIEKYTHSKMNVESIPSKELIYERQEMDFYNRLITYLDRPITRNERLISRLKSNSFDPLKVLNALIEINLEGTYKEYKDILTVSKEISKRSKSENKPNTKKSTKKEYVCAKINLGKNQGIKPQILLSFINKVGGVHRENVGLIRVEGNVSFIDITKKAFGYLQNMNGKKFEGTKVVVTKVK